MRRKVAETAGPFFGWEGGFEADRTDRAVSDVVATFTHFDHVLTAAALANTAIFTPE